MDSILYNSIKIIFLLLDIGLLAAFVAVIFKSSYFYPPLKQHRYGEQKILTLRDVFLRERWQAILKRLAVGTPEAVKIAIIEADQLADDILKRFELKGEHMADRLDQLSADDLLSLDRLWRAHRIRNQLVHEPDFRISQGQTEQVIGDYEAFLKEVGVI